MDPRGLDAEINCIDKELVDLEHAMLRLYLSTFGGKSTVHNIGAGKPEYLEQELSEFRFKHYDLNPSDKTVSRLDIVEGVSKPLGRLVLAKRVVSNLEPINHYLAIQNLRATVKPGGLLFLMDAFSEPYQLVNQARTQAGLSELQTKNYLPSLKDVKHWLFPCDDFQVDTGYYLWTRLWYPLIKQRFMSFESHALRGAFPQVYPTTGDEYGVHRLLIWRRSR